MVQSWPLLISIKERARGAAAVCGHAVTLTLTAVVCGHEGSSDKRWGHEEAYLAYKRETWEFFLLPTKRTNASLNTCGAVARGGVGAAGGVTEVIGVAVATTDVGVAIEGEVCDSNKESLLA